MSVYLSVAPPDGFTKWGESEWDRWLRDHPWESAERVCSRGDWAIFLFQLRQNADHAKKLFEPLLDALINERPLASQQAEDLLLGLETARGELSTRPAAVMRQQNGHFASAEDLDAMVAAARARIGGEPTLADVWKDVLDQLEKVLEAAQEQKRGVYFGNV